VGLVDIRCRKNDDVVGIHAALKLDRRVANGLEDSMFPSTPKQSVEHIHNKDE
jgi:hypothetical protein